MSTRAEKSRNKQDPREPQSAGDGQAVNASSKPGKSARAPRRKASSGDRAAASQGPKIKFGREVCGNLDAAEAREWIVTNGVGGFASGTIAGCATRRYHGLLIAALHPPVGRMQLVSGLDEIVRYAGTEYSLATHRWARPGSGSQGIPQHRKFSTRRDDPGMDLRARGCAPREAGVDAPRRATPPTSSTPWYAAAPASISI